MVRVFMTSHWLILFMSTCPKAGCDEGRVAFQFPENANGGAFATPCFNYE
jgi:hypothetical protein